ncbi:MAG: MazG family protein [Butyrivibrio sp.]|nr:MazG family protein [Butyrivibrio sp.]
MGYDEANNKTEEYDEYKNCKYTGYKKYIEKDVHNLEDLKEIVHILRGHCPWDKTQTLQSLKKTMADETQEVLDAIDNNDADNLCEELGDVLLQLVFMADIAKEKGLFSMDDVIQGISDKMVRRHPHVFGDIEVNSQDEIHEIWKQVKAKEKEEKAKRIKKRLE